MNSNPLLGVVFHWLGGLASGSFYVPYRGVKKWAWETYWLVGGFFSWIIAPWVLGTIMTGVLIPVLSEAPAEACFWSYFWGAMWGLGGLTFGLTMRYLGMSLGMAVALSYCSAFGTLMPPLFEGKLAEKFAGESGHWVLFGIIVCLIGIAITGMAGMSKDREMPEEQKRETIKEFNFWKGILVATFSGVMSASFSYGLAAGDPIKNLTLKHTFLRSAKADSVNVSNVVPLSRDSEKELWAEIQKSQDPSVAKMVKVLSAERTVTCGKMVSFVEKAQSSKVSTNTAAAVASEQDSVAILAAMGQAKASAAAGILKYFKDLEMVKDSEVRKQASEYASLDLKQETVLIANAGGDIKKYVAKHTLWQGLPVLVVVLLGGFTTNFIWCMLLNFKNKTGYQYFSRTTRRDSPQRDKETIIETAVDAPSEEVVEHAGRKAANNENRVPMLRNYLFSALAGVTWYLQFFFYSMGETQMGDYKFSSWTLHMASIIIFSSLWGIGLKEWKGTGFGTKVKLTIGLATLILSTIIVGYGNYLASMPSGH